MKKVKQNLLQLPITTILGMGEFNFTNYIKYIYFQCLKNVIFLVRLNKIQKFSLYKFTIHFAQPTVSTIFILIQINTIYIYIHIYKRGSAVIHILHRSELTGCREIDRKKKLKTLLTMLFTSSCIKHVLKLSIAVFLVKFFVTAYHITRPATGLRCWVRTTSRRTNYIT